MSFGNTYIPEPKHKQFATHLKHDLEILNQRIRIWGNNKHLQQVEGTCNQPKQVNYFDLKALIKFNERSHT